MVKKTEEEAKASMAATSFQSHSKTYGALHYDESSVAAGQHSLENVQSMDHLSSESEFSPKVRKPYTITKQRERWKEEEHEKFLEAMKLYGRDWRQIEEHVGTKTAVQIRSHAQKFFSKVTRNSNGCTTTLVECIEIPPPRPKRKPLHPYPRKEAHHLHKVPSIQEQTRSLSPQLSVSEQECQSPTSIVAAASGSDTLISAKSSILYDSESPDSSIPFVSGGLACTEPNSSSLENESPTPNLETENSMPHEKYSKNFELFPEEDADEKDVSTQKVSMQSLKLFGRTVLVTNPHKPIPTLEICAEEPTNKHVGNYKQTSPWNSMVTESSIENIECTKSHGAFYFIQLNNGNSNQGEGSAVPVSWWSSCGGFPFTFVHYSKQETAKEESDLNSEVDDKESHKDQSWCGSNTGLVNGGEIDDKYVEIDIQSCLENKNFVSVSKHKLIGKPLYSEVRIRNGKNRKGFVPYKRCIAEKRNNQSTIAGADGEEKRIRLCL